MKGFAALIVLPLLLVGAFALAQSKGVKKGETGVPGKKYKVVKSEAEWRKQLSPLAFKVLRERDTEQAFSGKYHDHHGRGVYECAGCGLDLFSSTTKFDSGTGWPSFYQPIKKSVLDTQSDFFMGYERTEVLCSQCGGHLGHVFDDGPRPTGLRYCINSVSLNFVKAK